MTLWLRGGLPFFRGDFDEAEFEWQRMVEVAAKDPLIRAWAAPAAAYAGNLEESLSLLADPELPSGTDTGSHLCRILWYGYQGERERALAEISEDFRKTASRDGAWSWLIASPLAYAGAEDEAIGWLECAVRRGGLINHPFLADHDPFLAKLRGNPRYEAMLDEAKEAWEAFEV